MPHGYLQLLQKKKIIYRENLEKLELKLTKSISEMTNIVFLKNFLKIKYLKI